MISTSVAQDDAVVPPCSYSIGVDMGFQGAELGEDACELWATAFRPRRQAGLHGYGPLLCCDSSSYGDDEYVVAGAS